MIDGQPLKAKPSNSPLLSSRKHFDPIDKLSDVPVAINKHLRHRRYETAAHSRAALTYVTDNQLHFLTALSEHQSSCNGSSQLYDCERKYIMSLLWEQSASPNPHEVPLQQVTCIRVVNEAESFYCSFSHGIHDVMKLVCSLFMPCNNSKILWTSKKKENGESMTSWMFRCERRERERWEPWRGKGRRHSEGRKNNILSPVELVR